MTDHVFNVGDVVTVDAPRHPWNGERCEVARLSVNPQGRPVAELRRPGNAGFNAYTFQVGALTLVERALIPETSPAPVGDHQPGVSSIPQGPLPADISSLTLPAVAQSAAGSPPSTGGPVMAGRRRKTENAELAQSDEALQSQMHEIAMLNDDRLEKAKAASGANARYRSAIKVAIKIGGALGITAEDIVWLITSQKRDPAEIDAETRRRNKLAELMELPIGTQLGMLDGQPGAEGGAAAVSVATRIEDRKMATADPAMAGTEGEAEIGGYKSYDLKMDEADNPYPADDARHAAWLTGRSRRKGEVAKAASEALSRPHPTPETGKRPKKNGATPQAAEPAADPAAAPPPMF